MHLEYNDFELLRRILRNKEDKTKLFTNASREGMRKRSEMLLPAAIAARYPKS